MSFPGRYLLRFLALCLLTGFFGGSLDAAQKSKNHPRLFYGTEDLPGLLSRINTPQGKAIVGRMDGLLSQNPDASMQGHAAAGWALRFALLGDVTATEKALVLAEAAAKTALASKPSFRTRGESNILPTISNTVGLAIAYDLCYNSWPVERRGALASSLSTLANQLKALGSEKSRLAPSQYEWVMCNAAAGLAALAVSTDAEADPEMANTARFARQQIGRFLEDLGDKGWPREGFGELRTLIAQGLGSFLLAWKHTQGEDLFTPYATRGWGSLYAFVLLPTGTPPAETSPDLPYFGTTAPVESLTPALRWEIGPTKGGDMAIILALADAASRAALQWTFDRCLGQTGNRSYDVVKPSDALFVLLGLPTSESSLNPASVLGHSWGDKAAGVFFARNRWLDSTDSIAAVNVNQRPKAGLRHFADSGSFRLLALGGSWAVQRAKDAADLGIPAREKENVVVIPGTHGWQGGKLVQSIFQTDGSGTVSMDLDAAYTVAPAGASPTLLEPTQDLGIRARRAWAVDYSGTCGAPVLLVLADQIRNGPTRRWLMHTAERNVRLHPDGFELRAANGATLRATVVAPDKPRLRVEKGEWTDTIAIDGESDFFVIMTVQPEGQTAPLVTHSGEGLYARIRVGNCTLHYDGIGIALQ